MNLSVVIPAYNEEDNIKQTVLEVAREFPTAKIIVINDASTDKTLQILLSIRDIKLHIINHSQNKGHGFSVVEGLKQATGNYVLYIDADRQLSIKHFHPWGDLTSGWRYQRKDKLFRKVISFCLRMTIKVFYRYDIKDANCPFKIYKREMLQQLLPLLPQTYIIPIACLDVLARKEKYNVSSFPILHEPYQGIRKGFLQSMNFKTLGFITDAFFEIISL